MAQWDRARVSRCEMLGALALSFERALINLSLLGGEDLISGERDPMGWYPGALVARAYDIIEARYPLPAPILEKLGYEMMALWYEVGPGRELVSSARGFLEFQTGSQGYASVMRGADEDVGTFALVTLDAEAGRAQVRTTSPFAREMERGVLLGGMTLAGDADYVEVTVVDGERFDVEFH